MAKSETHYIHSSYNKFNVCKCNSFSVISRDSKRDLCDCTFEEGLKNLNLSICKKTKKFNLSPPHGFRMLQNTVQIKYIQFYFST